MAMDPNIILQAGKGVTPIQDPIQSLGNALQLQALQQKNQIGALDMNQRIQQQQRMASLREALMTAKPEDAPAIYAQNAMPKEASELSTALKNQEAAKVQLQKSYLESDQLEQSQIKNMVQGVGSAAQSVAQIKDPSQQVNAWAQSLQSLAQQYQPTDTDTPKIRAIKQNMLQQMSQEYQSIQEDPSKIPDLLDKHFNDAKKHDEWIKEAEAKTKADQDAYGQPVPAKEGFFIINKKTGEPTKLNGFTPIPPQPNQMTLLGSGGGLTPDGLAMLVDKYRKTGILDGDVGRNPALRAQVVNAAAAADKAEGKSSDLAGAKMGFKTTQEARTYFTTGKGADAFRQQETILHHADAFSKIADALNNGDMQGANKLANAVGIQLGSDKATNYKIVSQIMSAEVGKYLAGGQSTEAERSELSNLIPSFSSPSQIKNGLQTLKTLVEGQRKSWTAQRDAALSGKVPGVSAPASGGAMSLDEYLKSKGH